MNIEKEREAFEQRFQHLDLDFVEDLGYCESETQYAWAAWCAATKRADEKLEGCVVVPVEPTYAMYQAYEKHSVAPMSTLSKTGYKAMVEAARGGK
ncbi:hypothetical protein [Acinetobacter sp. ANC 3882]|uniref:hypothetical protein n=1 Tax=Acinetobacter sp. ANC 3882 TaxID=2923423 RepID=UPI001F4B0EA2|nr:hypothetical protein [Acinetobacter sp. ANC 3882]MCH7312869.1 hypothetical protein [Acinetobacter sp. ANC 3882]